MIVTVDLTEDAIVIATREGAPVTRWPYPEVMRAPSVRGRLRLGLAGNGPPARLSIPEPAFAETKADAAGSDARACVARTGGGIVRGAFTIPRSPGRRPPTIP